MNKGMPSKVSLVKAVDGQMEPENQSDNWCRHFGTKTKGRLVLNAHEVEYLNGNNESNCCIMTKAYFFIKSNCCNLLLDLNGDFMLYKKHKNFNRKKDKPMCSMKFVGSDDAARDAIGCIGGILSKESLGFCVLSESQFTFLKVTKMECLDMKTPLKLKK
ncbi:hypothetical protein CWI42_081330 [Ordospora colligata]|uniref:Uncharacterized protein n=1 Tax=Ordospora colligata OC4 TaxID=1354746 RepID=A0A0B2UK22_9MICR|nr:uncharacterized protein M896_081330 [Ordospora colligata OC4]KHN69397.1 hypothetical protein M896_081330 [Ordospora colligata OC4]TBU14911.1 hypothetical protein CWI41_081320 [Ordospora colligata]TBU15042.1 hypothetical protein CWI40_081340 [Ordospora colligata]TBU18296.1 hypothetical protein CWI42_081330 [Ordospora colligata]